MVYSKQWSGNPYAGQNGSASPKGEARRARAAKPKRSAGRGGENYAVGVGGSDIAKTTKKARSSDRAS